MTSGLGPEDWLDHETWVRDCFAVLGEVGGKRVLDYGCGLGLASVVLAQRGAQVLAFDRAPDRAQATQALAAASGQGERVRVAVMAAEALAYRDEAFDAVYGNAILHHVRLDAAGLEPRRVLRPGGIAVFAEPLGENPLLQFARRYLPYPGKARDPGERPLRYQDLEALGRALALTSGQEYQLLSMVRRLTRNARLLQVLEALDGWVLPRIPGLRRWCRYVVLVLRKPAAAE